MYKRIPPTLGMTGIDQSHGTPEHESVGSMIMLLLLLDQMLKVLKNKSQTYSGGIT
jgi:hypothetical protein